MLVIVEGPDGAGKTRLCSELRKNLDTHTIFMYSNSKATTSHQLIQQCKILTEASGLLPVICDRYPWFSERIYGPILRGEIRMTLHIPADSKIIYCRPPTEILHRCAKRTSQPVPIMDNYDQIISDYDKLMETIKVLFPVLYYDYTTLESQVKLSDFLSNLGE